MQNANSMKTETRYIRKMNSGYNLFIKLYRMIQLIDREKSLPCLHLAYIQLPIDHAVVIRVAEDHPGQGTPLGEKVLREQNVEEMRIAMILAAAFTRNSLFGLKTV